jgi:capsid protein
MDLQGALFGDRRPLFGGRARQVTASAGVSPDPWRYRVHDGSKFPGGYGATEELITDYWTLRKRSAQLFKQNLYARALIRRLITNEINTGLHLEATPEESLLGMGKDALADWSETVEIRFGIWARNSYLCDHTEARTFGALQQVARQEALIDGDILVVLRQDQRTRLPRVQLINGGKVQTPIGMLDKAPNGNRLCHGVELDAQGRHAAYWIAQEGLTYKRLPAIGEKSGKRLAWLLYGGDKRMDDVRGEPLLSLVLQSLREIDRFRDSTQRKAVIQSLIAGFIEKTVDKPGSQPLTGAGAMRRGAAPTVDASGAPRDHNLSEVLPGLWLDELQVGEKVHAFQTSGTLEDFGTFEAAVLAAVAMSNGMPPEIFRLTFSSNYSASQAAINEFKTYLNMSRTTFGENFCDPTYQEWLYAEILARRISAPGFLEAWRDWRKYDVLGAWTAADWAGNIKPAVDLSKLVRGYKEMVDEGFITRARAARELTGMKYSKVGEQLLLENELLARANKPLAELEASKKPKPPGAAAGESVPATGRPDGGESDGAESDEADESEERLPN